jgi:ABC-type phosphate/phosphonate transport system ATPase subunit
MIIGVTGGIGSGKSTILRAVAQQGYAVYDCDAKAKRIIMEDADVRKQMLNRGRDARLSFLRTDKGFEVDLIIARGSKIQPVEIKSAMTYHNSLAKNLRTLAKSDGNVTDPVLIYDGDEDMPSVSADDVGIYNFRRFRYADN